MDRKFNKLSRFISMILRHGPEIIDIELDEHGWCNVEELVKKMNAYGKKISKKVLEEIVAEDSKQRYSFNEDYTKIRANQGHSINVNIEFNEEIPPEFLYHGTVGKYLNLIFANGIKKMKRQFVHLSSDIETAKSVGKRRGTPIVIKINSAAMFKDGYIFYKSKNNVWLTEFVPREYISIEV